MSVYYTDVIEITPVTYDTETNEQTKGTSEDVAGYWEEDSGIEYSDGLPVGPKSMVFFPESVTVKKGDLIRLLTKGSRDMSTNPEFINPRIVKKSNLESSLGSAHYEVTI